MFLRRVMIRNVDLADMFAIQICTEAESYSPLLGLLFASIMAHEGTHWLLDFISLPYRDR